jgi:molecular chaperone GrpE
MSKKHKKHEATTQEEPVVPEVEETPGDDTEQPQEEPTIEELQQARIEELEAEVKRLKNEFLKAQADVENTKKRLEKERVIERKYAAMPAAKAFMSPLDHFELALSHIPQTEEAQSFAQGFRMILNEIKKNLEEVGVTEIAALGEPFDPNFHQAVLTEHRDDVEADQVIDVLQKGYLFKDRVLRPAMVKISE